MRLRRTFKLGRKFKGKRQFDLSRFKTPGEFRKKVPTAGSPFCLATQKIMGKYDLTFSQACELLEEKGYLFWAGVTPVYNLAGNMLWLEKEEAEAAPPDDVTTEEEEASLFTPDQEIRCNFFSLVVRNSSLDEKYPGGLDAFVKRYSCDYNHDIAVQIAMGGCELDDPIEDMVQQGLETGEDFALFDAFNPGMFQTEERYERDIGVGWLKVIWLKNGNTLVSLRPSSSG